MPVTLLQARYEKQLLLRVKKPKNIYKIFHNVNCASSYTIYLMECILCNKQYVGKAETSFNIRLNNNRKDVKKVDAKMACKHFQQESHNFNKHAKFNIINQLMKTSKSKETLTQRLIERENFWILKLDTLYPKGFNMELSKEYKYNKRLLSCINCPTFVFHCCNYYVTIKLRNDHYERIYLTSYSIWNLHNFK